MNTSRNLIIVLSLTLSLVWASPALAGKGKYNPKPHHTPVPKKVDASAPKIESVSGDSISVKSSKTTRTYKIDGRTLISVNSRKATAADLKTGMDVEIDSSTINPDLAVSIKAASK